MKIDGITYQHVQVCPWGFAANIRKANIPEKDKLDYINVIRELTLNNPRSFWYNSNLVF